MRHLCIFISLIFLNQISYAVITIGNIEGINSYSDCSYQGTVIDLKKIDSDIELVVNTKNNLDDYCSVPLNENIRLIVPGNKEIKIGSDVKFSANKAMITKRKSSELNIKNDAEVKNKKLNENTTTKFKFSNENTITEYKFNHWE